MNVCLCTKKFSVVILIACLMAGAQLFGADILWKGSNNPYWSDGANWVGGAVPGVNDVAVFDPGQQAIGPWNFFKLNVNATVAGLRFTNLTQSVSCGSTGDFVLRIGTNGVSVAGRDVTLGMTCELTADQRWTVVAGVELRHSGKLAGSAKLTKSGAGRAWLSGASTFTGECRVEAGTLKGMGGFGSPVMDGLEVWMDAAAMETIVTNALGAVTSWTDRAGGETMTPVGAGGGPLYGATLFNGRPGLRFDKTSNNGLQMEAGYANTTNVATAFVMMQRRSAQTAFAGLLSLYKNGGLDYNNANSAAFYHFGGEAPFYLLMGYRNSRGGGAINLSFETPICLMSRYNGQSHTLVQDGVIAGSVGTDAQMYDTFNSDRLILGNRPVASYAYPFNGDVAEVLVYNRTLTAAEEQQVSDYLIAKWKPMESVAELLHDAALWFDTSVAASITTNASGAVTAWASLVSEAKLIQYEAQNYPALVAQSGNGLPAVRFNKDVANNLQCSNAGYYNLSSALTFFVSFIPEKDQVANAGVASVFGATGWGDFNENKNAILMYLPGVSNGQEWSGHRNSIQLSRSYATPGVPAVAMSSFDGAEHIFTVNGDAVGVAVPSQGAFDAHTLRLGERREPTRRPFNGDIQEVLVYNRQLSAHEQSLVTTYLEKKWVAVTNLSEILAAADVHLDASVPSSIMTDSGGNVTNWASLTDGTAMNVPTNGYTGPLFVPNAMNGKSVLRFNSSLKRALFMESGYTNKEAQVNAFIVMRRNADLGAGAGLLSIYNSSGVHDFDNGASAVLAYYPDNDTIAGYRINGRRATITDIPYNAPVCLLTAFNGMAHTMSLNNGTPSSSAYIGKLDSDRLCLGTRYEGSTFVRQFSGDVAEVLIYNRALSLAEKELITGYLTDKWMPETSASQLDSILESAVLWLDAAAADTLVTDGNNQITAWSNRIVNTAAALAPPAILKGPTVLADGMNGRPVLRFDKDAAVKQALMIDTGFAITGTASTAVIMLKTRSTQSGGARLANIWSGSNQDYDNVTGGIYAYFVNSTSCKGHRGNDGKSGFTPLVAETPVCLFSRFDGSRHRMIKDEWLCTPVNSSGEFNANRFGLGFRSGANEYFNGDIAEVLVFNYALTPVQQKILYNYLQEKWVTPVSTSALEGVQLIEVNSGAQLDVRDLNGLTLAESGKLSGAGAVLGDLTVAQGGTIEATSEGSDHTLAVTGDLTFESGATVAVNYLSGAPLITTDGLLTLPSGITFAVANLKESGRGGKLPVLRGGSWDNGASGVPSASAWTLEGAGGFTSFLLDGSEFSVNLRVTHGTLLMIQ